MGMVSLSRALNRPPLFPPTPTHPPPPPPTPTPPTHKHFSPFAQRSEGTTASIVAAIVREKKEAEDMQVWRKERERRSAALHKK